MCFLIMVSIFVLAPMSWAIKDPAPILPTVIRIPEDYSTIQQGIDAAPDDNAIVLVADGTYKGVGNKNLDFKGKRIVVTSENGAESTIIDCEGSGRGFYFHSGETPESILSGFTIMNSSPADVYRGAICCINLSSPTIENNVITDNNNGGIYCYNASPIIRNNVINRNSSSHSVGGGVCCARGSSPQIVENNICENIAADGGGIYTEGSNPQIVNNTIRENSATNRGGGLALVDFIGGELIVSGNVIVSNSAGDWGGGINFHFVKAVLSNNIIANNMAAEYGGGIGCTYAAHLNIFNSTISGNRSQRSGGIALYEYSTANLLSTIVWSNTPSEIFIHFTSLITATYSDIENGFPGEGNIDSDPCFVDSASGDYHLREDSPCIGKGIMTGGVPNTDIEGNPRPNPPYSRPDMGAYEHSLGDTYNKVLNLGWELISIPVWTTDSSLEHVLQSISDSLQSVWHYDSNSGRWKKYIKNVPPGFNDLDTIEPKKGYWVNMTQTDTLEVTGVPITDTAVPLNPGWNLIGYPSLLGKPIDSALSSIFQQYLAVWAYDDKWYKNIKGAPPGFNDLDSIEPWGGYWFNVSTECVWDINAPPPAPPLGGIVVKSPHILPDMPKMPYIIWGEVSVGADPTLVFLKSKGIIYTCYQLRDRGSYMLEVPSDVDGLELYVRVDGADIRVSPVPIGRPGEVVRHDISLNMLPKESRLYQNYPNPFNPDTWIPYQLSESADVVIRIYTSSGQLVRELDLGHKPAGIYVGKDRSAYWDGRNEVDEQVSSGVYFYTIQAGEFTDTKKMVIVK